MKNPSSLIAATLRIVFRTRTMANIWSANGPRATPDRGQILPPINTRSLFASEANRLATGRELVTTCNGRPTQQPCHLIGGAAAVQEDRIAVLDQGDRLLGDGPFLFPMGRLPGVEMGQFRRSARVEDAAVDPLRGALFFEIIDVAANRRLGDRQLFGQFRQGDETPAADEFEESISAFFGEHGRLSS